MFAPTVAQFVKHCRRAVREDTVSGTIRGADIGISRSCCSRLQSRDVAVELTAVFSVRFSTSADVGFIILDEAARAKITANWEARARAGWLCHHFAAGTFGVIKRRIRAMISRSVATRGHFSQLRPPADGLWSTISGTAVSRAGIQLDLHKPLRATCPSPGPRIPDNRVFTSSDAASESFLIAPMIAPGGEALHLPKPKAPLAVEVAWRLPLVKPSAPE